MGGGRCALITKAELYKNQDNKKKQKFVKDQKQSSK